MTQPPPARPGGSGTDVAEESAAQAGEAPQAPSGRHASGDAVPEEDGQGPVIRDKRRLDPETGQVRAEYATSADAAAPDEGAGAAADPAAAGGTACDGEVEAARALADERLADLQRLQAEFVNSRRRVERDRDVAREVAVASVLEALLPVLDDVHLARRHGDLEGGPFAAIAEKLEATLARLGLVRYGEPGETFDPTVHEALLHTEAELAEGTTDTTVVQILQPGYRAGERVLRAARVAVADPH